MKKLQEKLNNFFKGMVKKLNNFRFASVVISSISLLVGIISLGLLFIYNFAAVVENARQQTQPSFVTLGPSGRIMGMVFFLFLIFSVIVSIFIVYILLPYILNKEKLTPKKTPLVMAVVNGGFQVVTIVFSILAIALETPKTLALYIVTIPFNVITCVANFLCIIPLLKCTFYQPAIGTKLCPKKEVKEEAK